MVTVSAFFGSPERVFYELMSFDIHVDVPVVPPTDARPWITLVTQGAGARVMNAPDGLDPEEWGRAEYLICLPPDWGSFEKAYMGDFSETAYWPIRLLKTLARLPINEDGWLGWGHTVDNGQPFADDTELCESLLLGPYSFDEGSAFCARPDGGRVAFYQVVPLYREEGDYAVAHNADALINCLSDVVEDCVDIHRPNCCKEPESA